MQWAMRIRNCDELPWPTRQVVQAPSNVEVSARRPRLEVSDVGDRCLLMLWLATLVDDIVTCSVMVCFTR